MLTGRPAAAAGTAPRASGEQEDPSAGAGGSLWRVVGIGLAVGLAAGVTLVLLQGRPASSPAGPRSDDAPGERVTVTVAAGGGVALPQVDVAVPPPAPAEAASNLGPAAVLYAAARDAHRAGDYNGAAARLREARRLTPDRPEIDGALATALEALGAERLSRGDFAAAAAALAEAVEIDPNRGNAWKALGYAQLRLNDRPTAMESLQKAVQLAPGDAQTRLLLGTALYQAGETAAAAEQLKAADAASPGDPSVQALLDKIGREAAAEQGYDRTTSAHFTVSFEGSGRSAQAGYLVSLLLEEAYHAVGSNLGYQPPEPVHAVLYPAEQFHDVTRSPSWAGALYNGKIRIPVGGLTEKTDLLARVIRHEYTHALVHQLGHGRAPVWLNEGLAMLNEGGSESELLRQYREYVRRGGSVPSLRHFEGSFANMNDAQAQFAYAQSLAATDYLVKSYGMGAARRLIEQLGEGRLLPEAIRATLYVSYEDFDQAWAASLR